MSSANYAIGLRFTASAFLIAVAQCSSRGSGPRDTVKLAQTLDQQTEGKPPVAGTKSALDEQDYFPPKYPVGLHPRGPAGKTIAKDCSAVVFMYPKDLR